jgi:hypothetical protein
MTVDDQQELVNLAESHRGDLDDTFFAYRDTIEMELLDGRSPDVRLRGLGDRWASVTRAVLEELRLLLCTKDKRYDEVRKSGAGLTKLAIPSIAAYVAGALGLSLGLVTAVAAFLALVVLKVGAGAFCRVTEKK